MSDRVFLQNVHDQLFDELEDVGEHSIPGYKILASLSLQDLKKLALLSLEWGSLKALRAIWEYRFTCGPHADFGIADVQYFENILDEAIMDSCGNARAIYSMIEDIEYNITECAWDEETVNLANDLIENMEIEEAVDYLLAVALEGSQACRPEMVVGIWNAYFEHTPSRAKRIPGADGTHILNAAYAQLTEFQGR